MLPILNLHLSSRPGSPQPSLEPSAPCWGLWGGIDPECIQYVMGTQVSCSLDELVVGRAGKAADNSSFVFLHVLWML